jgi:adenylate kinase family enzyme
MARKQPRETAHAGLDRLAQELASAKKAVRDAEAAVREAHAEIGALEERIRDAYAAGEATAILSKDLALARAKAEEASLAVEGISRRVRAAELAHERYMGENRERLVAELRPAAEAVVQRLEEHAQGLQKEDLAWHTLARTAAEYLKADNIIPVGNQPGDHALAGAVRAAKDGLQQGLVSPLPHLSHHTLQREDEQRKLALKRQRKADRVA